MPDLGFGKEPAAGERALQVADHDTRVDEPLVAAAGHGPLAGGDVEIAPDPVGGEHLLSWVVGADGHGGKSPGGAETHQVEPVSAAKRPQGLEQVVSGRQCDQQGAVRLDFQRCHRLHTVDLTGVEPKGTDNIAEKA